MKICFLIVIYNKQLDESTSLKTLIDLMSKRQEVAYLRIVNNGPREILNEFDSPKNVVVDFQQSITNRPLSRIYNEFIKDYEGFERFILLDDDSTLTVSFINRAYISEYYDLELPKIINQFNQLSFPHRNGKPIMLEETINMKNGLVTSIGSGLIISASLIKKFEIKDKNLFNPSFSFYGVDYSLFWEIKKSNLQDLIISSKSEIFHHLSIYDVISDWREREIYLSSAIALRHYPRLVTSKSFVFLFFKYLSNGEFEKISEMIGYFLKGKHPNCIDYS